MTEKRHTIKLKHNWTDNDGEAHKAGDEIDVDLMTFESLVLQRKMAVLATNETPTDGAIPVDLPEPMKVCIRLLCNWCGHLKGDFYWATQTEYRDLVVYREGIAESVPRDEWPDQEKEEEAIEEKNIDKPAVNKMVGKPEKKKEPTQAEPPL